MRNPFRHRFPAALSALALAAAMAAPGLAQTHMNDHGAMPGPGDAHEHAAHAADHAADHRMPIHLAMAPDGNAAVLDNVGNHDYRRTLARYDIPDVTLRDAANTPVNLRQLLDDQDSPVLLNFIFTSCATICPVMSATFGHVQPDVTRIAPGYRMISISIDPEYDTPARLRDYATLHDAAPNWRFLTGDFADVMAVVEAFDAVFRSKNKMYHKPLTFLRAAGTADWVRLEGLLSAEELTGEYASLVAGHAH